MKVGIVTLGCDKNTVDAEYVAGWLERRGIGATRGELEDASLDGVVILTCGFIADARAESEGAIAQWAEAKRRRGAAFALAVAGCLSQTGAAELRARHPEIDLVAGVGEFEALAAALGEALMARQGERARRADALVRPTPDTLLAGPQPRRRLDASATAYLKIADGCDYACAFCVIPRMKGRYRSVAPEIVLDEARELLARGAREIVLVAQDVSAYGRDLGGRSLLPELLGELCALPGEFWLRIMYFYPGGFSEEFIEAMAASPKICPYLDVPLQHLDPGICRAMKRPYGDVRVMDWIERLRVAIPDVALRTTFVVGFPGEGKREFMNLYDGLGRIRFDHVGFFSFSPELGAPAAEMPGQVSAKTALARCQRLARRQLEIAQEANERFVGREIEVLVDGRFPETDLYVGHSRYQGSEVDGMTRFVSAAELEAGEVARVRIERVDGFDLVGVGLGRRGG